MRMKRALLVAFCATAFGAFGLAAFAARADGAASENAPYRGHAWQP